MAGRIDTGRVRNRTVFQTPAVQYSLTLQYLGHNRVAADANYRCKYELMIVTPIAGQRTIPNIAKRVWLDTVAGRRERRRAENACKFVSNGGTGGNVPDHVDTMYKIVACDNHSLPGADSNLLGAAGNNTNRPDYYRDHNWIRDVKPVVPFRVVVRKFLVSEGVRTLVDIDDPSAPPPGGGEAPWTLKVAVEVKDPNEAYDVHADEVRPFLQRFFRLYNRTGGWPYDGDDNCTEGFKGVRTATQGRAGVKTSKVLREINYVSPPIADEAAGAPATVAYNTIPTGAQPDSYRTTLNIRVATLNGKKVGVSDFVFMPPPVGGDNYRFLLALMRTVGGRDQDIRDQRVRRVRVTLGDESNQEIEHGYAYTSGRFTIWKRLDLRLACYATCLAPNSIDWDRVRASYAQAFVDLRGPVNTFELPLVDWYQTLRAELGAANAAIFANRGNFRPPPPPPPVPPAVAPPYDRNTIYRQGLIPPALHGRVTTDQFQSIARRIIRLGCMRAAPAIPYPGDDAPQNNVPEGMFMLYALPGDPAIGLLGVYMGDGQYFVGDRRTPVDTTSHEMGHGIFLRHSYTNDFGWWWQDVAGDWHRTTPATTFVAKDATRTAIHLIDPQENCFPLDHAHDPSPPDRGFRCMMSYMELEPFCGICALGLRFYDRVQVQAGNRFQNQIMAGAFPALMCTAVRLVGGAYDFTDVTNERLNLTVAAGANHTTDLSTLGPETEYRDSYADPPAPAARPRKGRVNLTGVDNNPAGLWSATRTGGHDIVTLATVRNLYVTVTGARAGNSTVTYSRNGRSVSVRVRVT
jgi:hypothetical protein